MFIFFFLQYVLFLWIPNDVFINWKRMILLYLNPKSSVIPRSRTGALLFLNTCIFFVNVGVFRRFFVYPPSSSLCLGCLKPSLLTRRLVSLLSLHPHHPTWVDAVWFSCVLVSSSPCSRSLSSGCVRLETRVRSTSVCVLLHSVWISKQKKQASVLSHCGQSKVVDAFRGIEELERGWLDFVSF